MTQTGTGSLPAARSVPLVGDEPAMREWAEQLVARARAEGVELTGDDGLLTALVRQVLQTGLEVELTDHLGYEPHAAAGRGTRQQPQRVVPEDGDDRGRRGRAAGPAGPQRDVRSADGPEGPTPARWADRQRDLAVREGHDDRRHPGAPAEIYGTDISRDTIVGSPTRSSRTCRRGSTGRSTGLSGDLDRRDRGQGPRRPSRQPADLCGDRRQPRRRTRRARAVGRPDRR